MKIQNALGISRKLLPLALLGALGLSAGCQSVAYHQKAHLYDAVMAFESDPTEAHFQQKCLYSREAAVGGIGGGAGGGCGCY
ncbi:MAG: hypothetical protein ACI9OU_001733 [Candidatus Promineifilaceae bacterium]|jgi:hypothetical protein